MARRVFVFGTAWHDVFLLMFRRTEYLCLQVQKICSSRDRRFVRNFGKTYQTRPQHILWDRTLNTYCRKYKIIYIYIYISLICSVFVVFTFAELQV